MRVLDVYRDERLVGHLREIDGETEFEYAPEYLLEKPRPISASLPLDPPLIRGARPKAFFGNLLPEGDMREDLSQRFKVDPGDDIGLLGKIGADCAGALVILPAGETPQPLSAPFAERYSPLEDAYEFGQYIEALKGSPSAAFKGIVTRMSLAGAQSKTVVARFERDRIYRSLGGATTHIVKIGSKTNHRGQEQYPGVVFNEYFCSKLAAACGLQVPYVEMLPYQTFRDGPPEYVFAIDRYDRHIHYAVKEVIRLHQEDFCQALGRPRTQKYEAQNGVTYADMFGYIRDPDQIVIPAISQSALLKAVLFNLIIGNRDSHAKNYSLLRSGFKAELAPVYDLVCTEIYDNVDQTLPQKVGNATEFEHITRKDIDLFSDQIHVKSSAVRRETTRLCNTVLKHLSAIASELRTEPFSDRASDVVEIITGVVANNATVMMDFTNR